MIIGYSLNLFGPAVEQLEFVIKVVTFQDWLNIALDNQLSLFHYADLISKHLGLLHIVSGDDDDSIFLVASQGLEYDFPALHIDAWARLVKKY